MTESFSQLRLWRRRYASRLYLRACSVVGADAEVSGSPRITNHGQIRIGRRFRLSCQPIASQLSTDSGGLIEIGDDVSIGHGTGISARGRIRIGDGSRLGAFVLAMDTDYHVAGDADAVAEVVPLEIGKDVRIGNNVTILKGSIIGDGARVLDGSVVRGAVPAGEIVQGVPARSAKLRRGRASADSFGVRVQRVAQGTFRLNQLPGLDQGPNQIAAWDSLGALSFVLALEDEFDVLVSEEQMSEIGCLADVARWLASGSAEL
jgi:maltose O-acetyltransferase